MSSTTPEVRRQVAAGAGDGLDEAVADLGRQLLELLAVEPLEVLRRVDGVEDAVGAHRASSFRLGPAPGRIRLRRHSIVRAEPDASTRGRQASPPRCPDATCQSPRVVLPRESASSPRRVVDERPPVRPRLAPPVRARPPTSLGRAPPRPPRRASRSRAGASDASSTAGAPPSARRPSGSGRSPRRLVDQLVAQVREAHALFEQLEALLERGVLAPHLREDLLEPDLGLLERVALVSHLSRPPRSRRPRRPRRAGPGSRSRTSTSPRRRRAWPSRPPR